MTRAFLAVGLLAFVACASHPGPPVTARPPPARVPVCPPEMAQIDQYCVDRWEDYVVEIDDHGVESPHSPYQTVEDIAVRAKSAAGVVPQGYISRIQAEKACANAGKRLCTKDQFVTACSGGDPAALYPYGGTTRKKGACNEGKGSAMVRYFGWDPRKWTEAQFNDPRLNQWEGGLARTGAHPACVSPYGVYDCVGNLHEWVDEPDAQGRGRFRGGFYGDAENNGSGCTYVTHAHSPSYHDYSTGFRCCSSPK